MQSVRETGQAIRYSQHLGPVTRNGALDDAFWDDSYSAVHGPSGAVDGAPDIVRDATRAVQAERSRRESEERLNLAMDAPDLGFGV